MRRSPRVVQRNGRGGRPLPGVTSPGGLGPAAARQGQAGFSTALQQGGDGQRRVGAAAVADDGGLVAYHAIGVYPGGDVADRTEALPGAAGRPAARAGWPRSRWHRQRGPGRWARAAHRPGGPPRAGPPCCSAKTWASTGWWRPRALGQGGVAARRGAKTMSRICWPAPAWAMRSSSCTWVARGQGQGPISARLRSSTSTTMRRRSSLRLAVWGPDPVAAALLERLQPGLGQPQGQQQGEQGRGQRGQGDLVAGRAGAAGPGGARRPGPDRAGSARRRQVSASRG